MTDDEILAGLMRRILTGGATVTFSGGSATVTLDSSPYSVTRDEVQAMHRAAAEIKATAAERVALPFVSLTW